MKKLAFAGMIVLGFVLLSSLSWAADFLFAAVTGYSGEIKDLFTPAWWQREAFHCALGLVACSLVARKMGLVTWRFAVCGIVSWPLTLAFLGAYPWVQAKNKCARYNYYALSLGLIFLVLYVFGTFISWFFIGNRPA